MFILQKKTIDPSLLRISNDLTQGACVSFEGIVRADRVENRTVKELLYIADHNAVLPEGQKIIQEAALAFSLTKTLCVQRIGQLKVGEIAIWVGVWAPHRDEAFKGCRYIIEEAKKRLLIWKKNFYTDGTSAWVHGPQMTIL